MKKMTMIEQACGVTDYMTGKLPKKPNQKPLDSAFSKKENQAKEWYKKPNPAEESLMRWLNKGECDKPQPSLWDKLIKLILNK